MRSACATSRRPSLRRPFRCIRRSRNPSTSRTSRRSPSPPHRLLRTRRVQPRQGSRPEARGSAAALGDPGLRPREFPRSVWSKSIQPSVPASRRFRPNRRCQGPPARPRNRRGRRLTARAARGERTSARLGTAEAADAAAVGTSGGNEITAKAAELPERGAEGIAKVVMPVAVGGAVVAAAGSPAMGNRTVGSVTESGSPSVGGRLDPRGPRLHASIRGWRPRLLPCLRRPPRPPLHVRRPRWSRMVNRSGPGSNGGSSAASKQ